MNQTHDKFDGRQVRIPQAKPGWLQPAAGEIGTVKWAGWGDQYNVFVDGKYYVRASAAEIEPNLVPDGR